MQGAASLRSEDTRCCQCRHLPAMPRERADWLNRGIHDSQEMQVQFVCKEDVKSQEDLMLFIESLVFQEIN